MGGMVENRLLKQLMLWCAWMHPGGKVKANDRHVNRLETTIDEECTR